MVSTALVLAPKKRHNRQFWDTHREEYAYTHGHSFSKLYWTVQHRLKSYPCVHFVCMRCTLRLHALILQSHSYLLKNERTYTERAIAYSILWIPTGSRLVG